MLRSVCKLVLLATILTAGACFAQSATPELDVQTSLVTNGHLVVNQAFTWVNRSPQACTITLSDPAQPWFSPTPVTVPGAANGIAGTFTVTSTLVGTVSYNSPCLLVAAPRVGIGSH